MKTVIFIPARFASTRFPGKPLIELAGTSGVRKTLIQRSWDAARQAQGVDAVYVLTDDARIADAARGFGADVLMTSSDARNGTERCAEALTQLGTDPDIVINLQGDAPLTPPWFVEALIDRMQDPAVQVATPVLRTERDMLLNFLTDRKMGRVGGTTAVMRTDGTALYFSKEVLPYVSDRTAPPEVWHHVGVYGYRPEALRSYAGWPEGTLEKVEGLEQLRFLEHGVPVACVEVKAQGRVFWELNNPVDVSRIESVLQLEGIE
ncbi:3-deoxy-manno-octulosonate cytidylyltransferase [Salipiger aestuarii]|uniref:3-deoxy-manno-octulosonate cytidylyltransferase (CMP-KDO synthetase) n=1 Tax=Salipiger aestuarii TaxID=568098 RepID=A0A327YP98_9RHOB|nr:manno-octulosonate cytidylyltransferase [Salipiger aestuarii]KAA8607594.1 3-deoxy-manno-octulosonate cytidylyltransferase [Salipiger aestuarii]KAB2539501.1 3-deoxy-manno-octulosonate cytidylyltransferase [Salipiger aestuarii]RAK20009.1 3-deoxy-manno-octulosonate cytidylyltransferase (CMP-KDO synthetase) [Salipiger aestuarii]